MKLFLLACSEFLDDALLILGCVCVLYGISKMSIVATWIIGGLMLIVFGVLYGKVKAKHADKRST